MDQILNAFILPKISIKDIIAKCFKDKINLNRWMVRNGHAVAYRRYSKEYILR